MKAFVNKFLKPKVSSEREVAQKKLFDHSVTLLTSAMLDGGKEACFSLAELYYYGNGYNILPNPDIGDLAMLIGKQLGNKECLEAELKNPENSENMKEVVSDIMNDIAKNEEISNLISDLEQLHLCYEDLKLLDPPVDSDIDEEWVVLPCKIPDEKGVHSPLESKIPPTSAVNPYLTADEEFVNLITDLEQLHEQLHLCYEGLKLVAPHPVDSDMDKGWVVIDSKTSDEKEISSSVKSKIPPPSEVPPYPADDLITTGLSLIGCTIS